MTKESYPKLKFSLDYNWKIRRVEGVLSPLNWCKVSTNKVKFDMKEVARSQISTWI